MTVQAESKPPQILAAYGSIRRGGYNYSLVDDCQYIGRGIVHGLKLYVDAQRPITRLDTRHNTIVDLYHVSPERLSLIDACEGAAIIDDRESSGICDRLRLTVEIVTNEKDEELKPAKFPSTLKAWVYVHRYSPSDRHRVGHGDYIRYLRDHGVIEDDDIPL